MIVYDKETMPDRIYIDLCDGAWSADKIYSSDNVEYIRADRYAALLEAAVSLHHWLFKIRRTYARLGNPSYHGRKMLDDAKLALDKWDSFCDGKVEEE